MAHKTGLALFALTVVLIAATAMAASNGKTQYTVTRTLLVAGSELQPGNYSISWKSNSPEADVVFEVKGKASVNVKGKLVDVKQAFQRDSVVIAPDTNGHEAIKEIRLQGKAVKIVFD